jgi:hypothetical protein
MTPPPSRSRTSRAIARKPTIARTCLTSASTGCGALGNNGAGKSAISTPLLTAIWEHRGGGSATSNSPQGCKSNEHHLRVQPRWNRLQGDA